MTTSDLKTKLGLCVVCEDGEKEISHGYTGDLLSWVMGRVGEGAAWVTVMTNVNVIAVAVLAGAACIVLAEGATLQPEALEKAKTQGVNVYSSDKSAFELCRMM